MNVRPERRVPRGFTLIELMVVVVIIAVLAVIAVPAVSSRMRDRRTQAAAQEVSTLFRNARLRALGRGAAVMVRYTRPDAGGSFVVNEAVRIAGNACDNMPTQSCLLPAWDATDSRAVTQFVPSLSGGFQAIRLDVFAPGNATLLNSMDLCFTPLGRTFIRYSAGAWTPLAGVPVVEVWRAEPDGTTAGLKRVVLVPPNGAARLGTAK